MEGEKRSINMEKILWYNFMFIADDYNNVVI